jgi:hypothetical protein
MQISTILPSGGHPPTQLRNQLLLDFGAIEHAQIEKFLGVAVVFFMASTEEGIPITLSGIDGLVNIEIKPEELGPNGCLKFKLVQRRTEILAICSIQAFTGGSVAPIRLWTPIGVNKCDDALVASARERLRAVALDYLIQGALRVDIRSNR